MGCRSTELLQLYSSAALIVNLHGATVPQPEHAAIGPAGLRRHRSRSSSSFSCIRARPSARSCSSRTRRSSRGPRNYGREGCRLAGLATVCVPSNASADRAGLVERRQRRRLAPVHHDRGWKQLWREITFEGEVYHWSKHFEFLKFLDLPARCGGSFELALTSYEAADRRLLEAHGWSVIDAGALSADIDLYRAYIGRSRGEFTVAKDQNVRLRTGWFSDRSAAYLAAGRPVVTQDSGFGCDLPTRLRPLRVSRRWTMRRQPSTRSRPTTNVMARRAHDIAAEYFDHAVVLPATTQRVWSVRHGLDDPRRHAFQQHHTRRPVVRSRPRGHGPLHARGSNGDATPRRTGNGKLRAVTSVSLDTVTETSGTRFRGRRRSRAAHCATSGTTPSASSAGRRPTVAEWLRQSGHDAEALAAAGKEDAGRSAGRGRDSYPAIVALDCIEQTARAMERTEQTQADAVAGRSADCRRAERHACQRPPGHAARAATRVHRATRRSRSMPPPPTDAERHLQRRGIHGYRASSGRSTRSMC